MISLLKKRTLPFVALIALFSMTYSGCTLSGIDKSNTREITENDLQATSQILSESLADENDGVISSLNDALTTVWEDGFVRTTSSATFGANTNSAKDDDDRTGRGRESNFSYSYTPSTGTHTLAFERNITEGAYSKDVVDTLKYVFTDNNGQFIEFPKKQEDRIETIDFKGFRKGDIRSPNKNSSFARRDTFLIDGRSDASSLLTIDGVHYGSGNLQKEKDNGNRIERSYHIQINFLNISINKQIVGLNQNLEQGVTGTLSWTMEINKTVNGASEIKTIEGIIELNGDGTALLRFQGFKKLFKINLDDGNVRDEENEFEGLVSAVNRENDSFSLRGGRTINVNSDTKIEGDITTLSQLADAIDAGKEVNAEGKGTTGGDAFVATEIKFESRDEDKNDEIDFNAFISNVDLESKTITLRDERNILVSDTTNIDQSGDYVSLPAVKEALDQGQRVVADGSGVRSGNQDGPLTALEIRFEQEEQDEVEFEALVNSVNTENRALALENERIVEINDNNTAIDSSGDYDSLQAVKEALDHGQSVQASGKAVETDKENIDLIATQIKFENKTEENDGD